MLKSTEQKIAAADHANSAGAVTTVAGVTGGGMAAFINEYYSVFMLAIALSGLIVQGIGMFFKVRYMKKTEDE